MPCSPGAQTGNRSIIHLTPIFSEYSTGLPIFHAKSTAFLQKQKIYHNLSIEFPNYFLGQKLIYRNNLLFSIEKFLLYFLKNLVDSNKT